MRKAPLVCLAVLALVNVSCESSGTDADDSYVTGDATAILGLKQDFECEYLQYDSVITYPPFEISVDTTFFQFSCVAAGSSREEFELSFDSTKTAALRITTNSVVNLGFYQPPGDRDSLVCFTEPAEIFPLTVRDGESWQSYAPPVYGTRTRLFLSWGFETTRRFERRESVLLPLGSFNCYVFSCEYRLPGDEEPFLTADEYYADGYGLVKMRSNGQSGSSHVFMLTRKLVGK